MATMKGRELLMLLLMATTVCGVSDAANTPKTVPALFNESMRVQAISNSEKHPWARDIQQRIVQAAQPWMKMSDDELWSLMFGPTIKRSWMVWSNGFCPACKESVPMYQWEMDALKRTWKTRCPHCKELFPKNDFHKFYLSGLDRHGIFDPSRADRSLLYNTEHPDPNDPLHKFGVDDGEGYVDGTNRWRFIGAYLIYGQWKQGIVQGIKNLGSAYMVTGDKAYAHKAAVLLDRVADLYPTHDFGQQGVMYEGPPARGYVSTWHDACWETQDMALAYDQIFDAIEGDVELQRFLAIKAKRHGIENPKASLSDVRRNIEDRILRDAIANRQKIESNFPQTDFAIIFTKTVLGWPGNRGEVMELMSEIIDRTTAVDGVTGEKGLTGYASLGPRSLGFLLERYAAAEPGFLSDAIKRHPRILDCFRFHVDTWCLNGSYYPLVGDCGSYAAQDRSYAGLTLLKDQSAAVNVPSLAPSMFAFLWKLYESTSDPVFVKILYRGNGNELGGLPHDLFAEDPAAFQESVQQVIGKHGTDILPDSVNKQQWHIGVLRSGIGKDQRALWLDYDSGGQHGHVDGMNLGLFGMGLDLLPDFGYPPVQYGGWGSPRARWYTMTAAHNTVVVDGKNQARAEGKTTLWANGKSFHAIRASCPEMIAGKQYERTAAMVDVGESGYYVLDVFRVVGGKDHAKFLHSHFGKITTTGLKLTPTADFTQGTQMRIFQVDASPEPGWSVDWTIEDEYRLLPPGTKTHFRYVDLTTDSQAYTAEQWVSTNLFSGTSEAWIPAVIARRQSEEPELASTFVALMEPYSEKPVVTKVTRLKLETPDGAAYGDAHVALEMRLADGSTDVFICADAENPLGTKPATSNAPLVERTHRIKMDGEVCLVRYDRLGKVWTLAMGNAKSIEMGDDSITLETRQEYVEIEFGDSGPVVVSGNPNAISEVGGSIHGKGSKKGE